MLTSTENLKGFKNIIEQLLKIHNPENPTNLELIGPDAPKVMEGGLNKILSKIGLKVKIPWRWYWKVNYK